MERLFYDKFWIDKETAEAQEEGVMGLQHANAQLQGETNRLTKTLAETKNENEGLKMRLNKEHDTLMGAEQMCNESKKQLEVDLKSEHDELQFVMDRIHESGHILR